MSARQLHRLFACGVIALALVSFPIAYSFVPSNFSPLAETIPLFLFLSALWHARAALFPSSWDVLGPAFSFSETFPDSRFGLITSAVITALGHGLLYFLLNAYVPKWSDASQRRMPASALFPTTFATLGLWSLNVWYLHVTSAEGQKWHDEHYIHTMFWLHVFGGLSLLSVILLRYGLHRKNSSFVSALEILTLNLCLYALLLFVFFPYLGEVL